MTRKGDTTPPEVRFWKKVEKRGEEECWNWMGAGSSGRGYGRFRVGSKGVPMVGPHRFSFELHGGVVSDGNVIMHSCDNPRCVNPKHLSAGTPRQNTLDAVSKGRMRFTFQPGPNAKRKHGVKLTAKLAAEIKSQPSVSCANLALQYGVSRQLVSDIRFGRAWRDA